jgi:4,5-DOPA dioxygenase extradiol
MSDFPSLFLAHVTPALPLNEHPARSFLSGLEAQLARPRAIIVISAHWQAPSTTIGIAADPVDFA